MGMMAHFKEEEPCIAVTRVVESESGVGGVACFQLESESGVGVGFQNCWSRSRESESVFQNCWSRSRESESGVGVGFSKLLESESGVGVRSRSRNICCNYRLQCLLNNLNSNINCLKKLLLGTGNIDCVLNAHKAGKWKVLESSYLT